MRLAALTVTAVCAVPLLPALTDTRLAAIMGARDGGAVAARKREFLDAATVSRGRLSTGARYWVTYAVHVLGIDPIQPRGASDEIRRQYEEWLEDMALWIVTFFPSGRFVSSHAARCGVLRARRRAPCACADATPEGLKTPHRQASRRIPGRRWEHPGPSDST
jgi:hypothetical protein